MTSEAENNFLSGYDPSIYDQPICTVDVVIFTIIEQQLHVLTVKRAEHPYQNTWSLVGGFIDPQIDLDLEATAKRKLKEKTGIQSPYLEQYGTIGNQSRDPRHWSLTTIYFALIPADNVKLDAVPGAVDIKWSPLKDSMIKEKLAFDHNEILAKCVERLRNKVLYTSLPVHLMPKEFTLGDLQKIYEIILETKMDHKSFRRRILNSEILEDTTKFHHEGKRPARLYRLKHQLETHYFLRNIESSSA